MAIQSIGSDAMYETGKTGTTNIMADTDFMAVLADNTGAAVASALDYTGNASAAGITMAATNSTYSSLLAAGGSTSYTTPSVGYTSGTNYLTGGASLSSTTTSGDMTTDVESLLSDTAASQAYLMGIQMQMGLQQQQATLISNVLNSKFSNERAMMNNIKF